MAAVACKVECPICSEHVSSFKVLKCSHKYCFNCTEAIAKRAQKSNDPLGAKNFACPLCRDMSPIGESVTDFLRALPTLYHGNLKCNICQEEHQTTQCYWCAKCVHIFCAVCHIDTHEREKGHNVHKWESLQALKDCCGCAWQISQCKPKPNSVDKQSVNLIKELCRGLEKALLNNLNEEQKKEANTDVEDKGSIFYDKAESSMGFLEWDISRSESMILNPNIEKMADVMKQIAKLYCPENQTTNFLSYFSPTYTRVSIDKAPTVEQCASAIWRSVKLKTETVDVLAMVRKHQEQLHFAAVFRGGRELFVGNLPWDISAERLEKFFSDYGSVTQVRQPFIQKGGQAIAFVTFKEPESLKKVLEKAVEQTQDSFHLEHRKQFDKLQLRFGHEWITVEEKKGPSSPHTDPQQMSALHGVSPQVIKYMVNPECQQ